MEFDVSRGARHSLATFGAMLSIYLLSGCVGGSGRPDMSSYRPQIRFEVDSDPIGGLVRINGIRVGTTPTGVVVEVNEDGTAWGELVLSVDQRINARAPGSDEVRSVIYRAGEDLPARIFFPLGGEPRPSGRALRRY